MVNFQRKSTCKIKTPKGILVNFNKETILRTKRSIILRAVSMKGSLMLKVEMMTTAFKQIFQNKRTNYCKAYKNIQKITINTILMVMPLIDLIDSSSMLFSFYMKVKMQNSHLLSFLSNIAFRTRIILEHLFYLK